MISTLVILNEVWQTGQVDVCSDQEGEGEEVTWHQKLPCGVIKGDRGHQEANQDTTQCT